MVPSSFVKASLEALELGMLLSTSILVLVQQIQSQKGEKLCLEALEFGMLLSTSILVFVPTNIKSKKGKNFVWKFWSLEWCFQQAF
jgi:hypothetical protein